MLEREVKEIDNILTQNIEIIVDKILRNQNIVVKKIAVVDSYNSTSKIALVHFMSDISKKIPYKNKTGEILNIGDKVYIFHEYGIEKQGWIMIKS